MTFKINPASTWVTATKLSDQPERVLLEELKYSLIHFTVQTTNRPQGQAVLIDWHCHSVNNMTLLTALFLQGYNSVNIPCIWSTMCPNFSLKPQVCILIIPELKIFLVMLITPHEHWDVYGLIILMLMVKQQFPSEPITASQWDCCFCRA